MSIHIYLYIILFYLIFFIFIHRVTDVRNTFTWQRMNKCSFLTFWRLVFCVIMDTYPFVSDPLTTISIISSRFSSNYEAKTSQLLESLEEMIYQYYVCAYSDTFSSFKSPPTYYCFTHLQRVNELCVCRQKVHLSGCESTLFLFLKLDDELNIRIERLVSRRVCSILFSKHSTSTSIFNFEEFKSFLRAKKHNMAVSKISYQNT